MKYWLLAAFLLTVMAINHGADLAIWLWPERFIYDCNIFTEDQKVRIRNNGLASLGLWGVCGEYVCRQEGVTREFGYQLGKKVCRWVHE